MEQPPPPEGLPVTAGGALLDLGSHAVNQALHRFGPVRSVYAELRQAPGGRVRRGSLARRRDDLARGGQLGAAG
jgi:predicted dehydrogenase